MNTDAETEAARLEGARLVARTILHHLNNALTPITGTAELLAQTAGVRSDPAAQELLQELIAATELAAKRLQPLRQLARLMHAEGLRGTEEPLLDLDACAAAPPSSLE